MPAHASEATLGAGREGAEVEIRLAPHHDLEEANLIIEADIPEDYDSTYDDAMEALAEVLGELPADLVEELIEAVEE